MFSARSISIPDSTPTSAALSDPAGFVRGSLTTAGRSRSPHWHIDYIRRHTALREIWFSIDTSRREHLWAAVLASNDEVIVPFAGFGASDCGCRAHLFQFLHRPNLSTFRRKLEASPPRAEAVSSAEVARWVSA